MKALLTILDDLPVSLIDDPLVATPNLSELTRLAPFAGAPACSPGRATIETGRYCVRPENWVGGNFTPNFPGSLPTGGHMLARHVLAACKTTAHIGKCHTCAHADLTWREAARAGYSTYGGSQANLGPSGDYFHWFASIQGALVEMFTYATDWVAAQAITAVQAYTDLITVAFNAVHEPLHYPPGMSGDGSDNDMLAKMAEYLDAQVGRVFLEARERGYAIIAVADNGGAFGSGGKFSLKHSAISVFCGHEGFDIVPRPISDLTDIHATVVDLVTGSPPITGDGISLLRAPRMVGFADRFDSLLVPPPPGRKEMAAGPNASGEVLKVIRAPATGEVVASDWLDQPTTEDVGYLLGALDLRYP